MKELLSIKILVVLTLDMGLLHFDVVYGASNTKFAKIDIKDIGKLTTNKPLSRLVYKIIGLQ